MAYNEVVIFFTVFICILTGFLLGVTLTYRKGVRDYESGYKQGCDYMSRCFLEVEDSKHRQAVKREKERQDILDKANEFSGITPDLLIAHGVTSVGDLPKHVREEYGVTEDNPDTIEDLIEQARK